jgi:hypothetical protein
VSSFCLYVRLAITRRQCFPDSTTSYMAASYIGCIGGIGPSNPCTFFCMRLCEWCDTTKDVGADPLSNSTATDLSSKTEDLVCVVLLRHWSMHDALEISWIRQCSSLQWQDTTLAKLSARLYLSISKRGTVPQSNCDGGLMTTSDVSGLSCHCQPAAASAMQAAIKYKCQSLERHPDPQQHIIAAATLQAWSPMTPKKSSRMVPTQNCKENRRISVIFGKLLCRTCQRGSACA